MSEMTEQRATFVAPRDESGAGIVSVVIGRDGSIEQIASATSPARPDCGT